jgi:hypothetical protein
MSGRAEVWAHTDHEEADDPSAARSLHDGLCTLREMLGVEMAVRIDNLERFTQIRQTAFS